MFYSILFPTKHERPLRQSEPEYFKDLHLNQIFDSILYKEEGFGKRKKRGLDLESIFYTLIPEPKVISYRQAVMRELEDDELRAKIAAFTNEVYAVGEVLKGIRDSLESMEKMRDNYLTRGQLIFCVERYCHMISSFSATVSQITFRSAGLRGFAEYLEAYAASDAFIEMNNHFRRLRSKLSEVEFCMLIKNDKIRVRKYEGQPDHAKELLSLFSKFNQDETQTYRVNHTQEFLDLHMEATLLNMAAGICKEAFSDLDDFCVRYSDFEDKTIIRFSREIQFYLSWLDYIAPLRQRGLPFCYPKLCDSSDKIYSLGSFDLALATRNIHEQNIVVPNDFEMQSPEHIFVVTGANQGGKTTFARTFGQLHHLATLGLCVPGHEAVLYLCDNVLTHFEREEDLSELSGKLQDDLKRLHKLLKQATPKSIIIINEIFSSTTLTDALSLGTRMMDALIELGAPAVVVTFLDELAMHGPETVSMMSIVREDSAERTFKIMRKPPDGLAYAMQLIKKHGLAYEQLSGRLAK